MLFPLQASPVQQLRYSVSFGFAADGGQPVVDKCETYLAGVKMLSLHARVQL